jgi:peptidoglycan/xylan/chitin deacetylase (PgdA/CDA1 family)
MYHSISEEEERGVSSYYRINTSPKVFAGHMEYLYENSFQVIELSTAVNYLIFPGVVSDKMVVLTFDDGYRDFLTQAFPILKTYRFPATVFLPTSYIGSSLRLRGKEHLSWNEVRELFGEGITFGSHTVTHLQLQGSKRLENAYELVRSKQEIEDNIGGSVQCFSYPYAFPEENKEFKTRLRDILEACGYTCGVTTIIGRAKEGDDVFFAKRIPANSLDDIPLYKAKLEGGYDWLHKPQFFFKMLKRTIY